MQTYKLYNIFDTYDPRIIGLKMNNLKKVRSTYIHTLNISMCPFAMTMSYELNEREAQEKPQQGKSLSKFEAGTGGHFGRMYTKT